MRPFIDSSTKNGLSEPKLRTTHCYVEVEYPFDEESSIFTYIIQRNETSVFIALSLESMFDNILNNLDTSTASLIEETWPLFTTLMSNGIQDKYATGALIRLEDYDTGDIKWFIATVVGNLNLQGDEWGSDSRIFDAIQLIVTKASELLTEMNENQPNFMRGIARDVMHGIGKFAFDTFLGILSGGLSGEESSEGTRRSGHPVSVGPDGKLRF